jgi:primosomal replication protein N
VINRFAIDAILAERSDLRHTPAGIPAIECVLAHRSLQQEAGGERRVECDVHAVAFGTIAQALSRIDIGSPLHCEGFVARRYRTGSSIALHLTQVERNSQHIIKGN